MNMTFDLVSLRFVFSAVDRISFPPGQPGNILRGAFGNAFRRIACFPDCPGSRTCPRREACVYARIFEPAASRKGPSGLKDWPRPFVFRAAYLDGRTVEPGERFWFDVNLFEMQNPPLEQFAQAFAQLAKGVGPVRGRADLVSVEQRPISISLEPGAGQVRRVRVEFVTPTELKSGDQVVPQPDFGVLFARVRDRISTLRALYGPGALDIDFRAMGERAKSVLMTRSDLRPVEIKRRSSRTGQVHGIGGFVGLAEYEAEYGGGLAEFIPYLEVASWTGVGRQCGWGKGELRVEILDAQRQ
jgi:CRISPR/Cas system endoribonuclease Cas6 (RAMP superfamily)